MKPFTALVKRTWRGAGGRYYAEVQLEHRNDRQVVAGLEPFTEGARVELEPHGSTYVLKVGGG